MRMFWIVLTVLAVVFAATRAAAHEDRYHFTPPDGAPEPEARSAYEAWFRHFFDVATKLVCEQPSRLQTRTLDLCTEIYPFIGQFSGVTPLPPLDTSPETAQRLAHEAGHLHEELAALHGTLRVRWDGTEALLKTPDAPVTLAAGLARYLVIEIENAGPDAMTATARFDAVPIQPTGPVEIAPSAMRAVVAPLLVDGATGDTTVVLSVELAGSGGNVFRLPVPVRVEEPARIIGVCVEEATGETTPARVYVEGNDGHHRFDATLIENSTVSEKPVLHFGNPGRTQRLPFFFTEGRFEVLVPPGTARVTLERGYEHPVVTQEITALQPGETREVRVGSRRFLDMKAEGWISGDTHIHWVKNWWSENEEIGLLGMVQRAEDLRVANNLTLKQVNPDETFIAPSQFPMGPIPGYCDDEYHMQMAEEYRNDMFYGHLCFLNITDLIEPISTGRGSGGGPEVPDYPTNRWAILECRAQGGIVTEAHDLGPFHRSDVPANAVLGLSDAFDQMAPENYYGFLDCGFPIPLGNGSDHPARLAGQARMYVKVRDNVFTYGNWIDGIREGRTFTTSGPLLFLTVNGRDIGEHLDLEPGEQVTVKARAVSRFPIGTLQVVSNGEVVKELKTQGTTAELEFETTADQPRWFVARCSRTPYYSALMQPDVAHTSVIFADVAGRRVFRPEAARRWISVLEAHKANIAENAVFENDAQREEAVSCVQEAIDAYLEKIAAHEVAVAPG